MKQLKSFLKQAAKDFRLVAKNGNRRPDRQPWVSPIENVDQNRTGNSSFSLTSLSCKRNSVHNAPVCTGQERNNLSSKKKKNRKLDPAKDFFNNPVQRSVNNPFVSGSQERNNSSKKTNFSSKGFVCNPADRPINEIFVSGGQERNNLSSSKKKKNRELDPAKDFCNNSVQRSVNGPSSQIIH